MPSTSVKLTIALIAVCGALFGAVGAALKWRGDNAVWRDRAIAAEVELVSVRPALRDAKDALEKLEEQSVTLQERVAELANEKAEAQDNVAIVEVERASFERIAAAYAEVSVKWSACVKGHEQYQQVLKERSKYDANDVKRFLRELEVTCRTAEEADEELRSQLSR